MMDFIMAYKLELGAALTAFLTVISIWRSMIPDTPVSSRLKDLHKMRSELIADQTNVSRKGARFNGGMTFVKLMVHKMQLMGSKHAKDLKMQLAQAGYRRRDDMMIFLFFKASLPLIFGVIFGLLIFGFESKITFTMKLLICLIGVFGGYYAPSIFVKNMKQKRSHLIQKGVPDALDLLVICAQAGLSLEAALKRVSSEMEQAYPELADELSLTAVELGFLPKRSEALINLNKRVDLQQVRSLVSTLMQTEKYGTPLSQSLTVLASEYRNERMMKAEEKAARLPAILTLPMIVFILPPLFIVLLAPGIINAIDSFRQMN